MCDRVNFGDNKERTVDFGNKTVPFCCAVATLTKTLERAVSTKRLHFLIVSVNESQR